MSESKDFASLSPKLLARKGGAKPAMRPQVQPLADLRREAPDQVQEDLRWNDPGQSSEELGPAADIVPITGPVDGKNLPGPKTPDVVTRREKLGRDIAGSVRPSRTKPAKAKPSAFTLRIDPDRHAKLRIACMATNQSAQQLLTQALDRMLAEIPEIRSMKPKLARTAEIRKAKSDV